MLQNKTRRNWFGLSLGVLTLLGCSADSNKAARNPEAPNRDALIGKWRLESIDGQPPASQDIRTWSVEFKPDGKWSYFAQMTERFANMPLTGSGTWKLSSGVLECNTADIHGRSTVTLADSLTLSPDPVI